MINLDQVRTLEWKVKQAVQLIVQLRRENDTLRGRLSDTEVRLQELETLLESFKATQNEMESGIRSALEDLDNLDVGQTPAPEAGPVDLPSTFAEEDPAAMFDKAPEPHVVAEDPAALEAPAEPSFEEEYAALEAQERAQAPESVELEDDLAGPDEASMFLEPEPEAEVAEAAPEPVEEKRPEQPGLGIF